MHGDNRQSSRSRAGKYLLEVTAIAFHIIAAVIWYLFIPWPWEQFEKPLGTACAVLATLFLTSLFIWWSIFGAPKSSTMTRD